VNQAGKSRFRIADGDEEDGLIKNRFTPADDGSAQEEIPRRRFFGLADQSERRRLIPIIIVSGVAVLGIAVIVILTFVFKKPQIFTPTDRAGGDSIYSGSDGIDLPVGMMENEHLRRGKESFERGYLNDALAEFSEVVESGAPDAEKAMALTYVGIIHDEKGDYNKAIESYRRAVTYDRKNPVIYRNLAIAYRHKKDFEKAGEFAGKALDIDSRNINNRMLLGNILYEQGRYKDAAKEYEAALDAKPDHPGALYNLAMSLYKKGDELAAIEYLKRAGAADRIGEVARLAYAKLGVIFTERRDFDLAEKYLSMGSSIAPSDPVNRYNLGIVYLKRNKPDQALAEFIKAEELGREDAAVLESLGEAYYSLKQYDRSLEAYNRVLEKNRRDAKILSRIAEIYYEKGELDRAYEYYHKITTMEPASENARVAYLNIGNILDDSQQFGEAVEAYNRALAISPKDDAALYNLGIAYKHAGKPERAIESWKRAAELNPDNPQPLLAIADYYYESKYYDMAMDEYQRVLRRFPNIQEGHFNLGTIYYKKNLFDYAAEEYRRVIDINGTNDLARKAYINLGVLTSRAQKPDEAVMQKSMGYVQKALLLKPGDAESLFSMGLMYSKKEMYERAIDTFLQAARATSDSKLVADSYNNIGKCYFKQGQFKKALQFFTRGVEEDPTNEEIRINRKVAMQAYEEELARR